MRAAVVVIFVAAGPAVALAGGSALSTHGPGTALEASYDVDITVHGLFATVETHQRVLASTTDPIEVVYELELPADAAITGFSITPPGAKPHPGVIVTEDGVVGEPSTTIHDDLGVLQQVAVGRPAAPDDPGAPSTYRYTAYPVADNGVSITVRWEVPVRLEHGRIEIPLPPRRGTDLAAAAGTIAFAAVPGLTAPRDLRAGGRAIAAAPGTKRVRWTLATGDVPLLDAEVGAKGTKPILLADTVPIGKGHGAIAAAVIAPTAAHADAAGDADLLFLIDSSKSMHRIDHATLVDAVTAVAEAAPASIKLQAIAFDHAATKLLPDWVENSPAGRELIGDQVTTLPAANGSDLVGALAEAAAMIDARRPTRIVIITDGELVPGLRGAALAIALGDRADTVDVSSLVVVPENQLAPSYGVTALTEVAGRLGGTVRIARAGDVKDRAARLSAELADGTPWTDPVITGGGTLSALPGAIAPGDGAIAVGFYQGKPPRLGLAIDHGGKTVRVAAGRAGVDAAALALERAGAALDLAGELESEASPQALVAWAAAVRAHGVVTAASSALVVDQSSKLARDRRASIAGGAPYVRLPPAPERDGGFADTLIDPQVADASGDGDADAAGGLDQDALKNIFTLELVSRLRGCYQQALPRNPDLRGRITFDLVIGDGEMIDATATGATEPSFRSCLVAAAMKVEIPTAADPALIRVRYPVEFTVAADQQLVIPGDADSSEPLDPSLLPDVHAKIDTSAADDPLGGMPK